MFVYGQCLFYSKKLDKVTSGSRIPMAGANQSTSLILSYRTQVIPNVCTKFQNPRSISSWEIFNAKFTHTQTNTPRNIAMKKKYKKNKHLLHLYTVKFRY